MRFASWTTGTVPLDYELGSWWDGSHARQPSRILALVGDLKEHLFHSYHKVDVETEAQISEVTRPRSHK